MFDNHNAPWTLGARFAAALQFAFELHRDDVRKATAVPYIAHLLGVCSLVLTDGGSEDEAVAALLHDALEDHPERVTRADIADRFGPAVLALVAACTDTPEDYQGGEKPPWRARKEAYLAHVCQADPATLRVSLADKLDNARSIVSDFRQIGDLLWDRFSAGKADQLWYYTALVAAYRDAGVRSPMLDELERVVAELKALLEQGAPQT